MVISRMQAREYAERLGYAAEVADARRRRQGAGRGLEPAAVSSGPCTAAHGLTAIAIARAGRAPRRQPAADVDRAGDQRRPARGRGGRRHPHRLAGGARRRRPRPLRRRLDRPRPDRGRGCRRCRRPAGAPSATSARRCWRRWSTGCCWSRSASRSRSPPSAALGDPPEIDGGGCSPSASSASPATSRRPRPRPRSARGHQPRGGAAPLGRRRARLVGVVLAGAFVLLGGSLGGRPDRRPPDRGADPRLLLAPDQGAGRRPDGGRPTRRRRRRRWGRRSAARRVSARYTTSTSGRSPPASARSPPTSSSPRAADRDLIRRRLELTPARALRDRAHDSADGGGGRARSLLHVENAPQKKS